MNGQIEMFPELTGKELRDEGMKKAVDHADSVEPTWSQRAYKFLLKYRLTVEEFMTEDVRKASKGIVPGPPDLRAWGSIVTKAARVGLIHSTGIRSVKDPKAHAGYATVWKKL